MLKKIAYLCLPMGLLGCGAAAEGEPPPMPAPKVGTVVLAEQDAVIRTELAGRTAAYRVAEIRPQVAGIVQRRLFTEGAEVKAGQVLYQIEAASYQAAREQAEASLHDASANLDSQQAKLTRQDELIKLKVVSQQAHDDAKAAFRQAQANYKSRQAALKAASLELERTRVVAPISGRIGRSTVSEGALVSLGQVQPMATLQQLDPIYVDIVQSSQALLQLKRQLAGGMQSGRARVALKLEDGSAYEHPGVLQFAEVNVDPASGAVTLRAQFPNPDGLLLPGMFVRAEVEQGVRRRALLVPQQGVTRNEKGQPTALVVNARNQAEARLLQVQGTQGKHWIVTAGLQAGDRLIVDGLQRAVVGQPVEPVALAPATASVASKQGG
ncbi:efflux RND transporter periplasmic adaptor subunit [Chitinimonas arctica]|uniref:Efflux RND transporter periplasmic adaptor subunit n=1 Tax=Chitinimonas arctica TaxID=2594795 RepID=A0A516SGR3_9NEIS|nr:efflux RND transporter periplasmic adaptor subunit [Chitinimonas arctica]QDQ27208.1 efflux RND transporter periplasmic adaptor subunit [Chitinimonas arctica]